MTSQGAPEAGAWAEAKATALWAIQRWQRTMTPQELTDAIFDAPAVRALATSPSPPPGVGKPGALVATDQRAEANEAPGAASPVGVEVVKLEWSSDWKDDPTHENALEDAAKAAFVKAQSVYRADHDYFPLKNTWETATESIREGWRGIAFSALEAAQMPPLGTQPEPRRPRQSLVPSSLLKEAEEALRDARRVIFNQKNHETEAWGLSSPEWAGALHTIDAVLARLGAAP